MLSGHIWSYEHIAKRIQLFRGREVTDLTTFDIDSPLYNSKKIRSVYKVYGTQNDRLKLTVSTQKSVLKNMQRVPRYRPKYAKFCWFGLEGDFLHFFGNILGLGAYFFKPIFALKPWVQAGRFEYHEPYNPNNFFSLIFGPNCAMAVWGLENNFFSKKFLFWAV